MKFLIDRCAGRRLADWLREQGHDVVESRERGLDPGDQLLLEWSAAEQRILVTIDKDFGQIVFTQQASHSGLVRLPDVPAPTRIALMRTLLENHGQELESRAIVTVRGGRIRISRPPEQ